MHHSMWRRNVVWVVMNEGDLLGAFLSELRRDLLVTLCALGERIVLTCLKG